MTNANTSWSVIPFESCSMSCTLTSKTIVKMSEVKAYIKSIHYKKINDPLK